MTEKPAEIKFGTDGWRAVIAREFTFANLDRVAQAYADFLTSENKASSPRSLVIVGFDRRFLSEYFAQRAAEIMTGNGFHVAMFSEAAPTPVISWSVKDLHAQGGIVITASHNPATFNGFKIKAPWGGSAAPETTAQVEKLVDVNAPRHAELSREKDVLLKGAIETYREQITSYVDLERIRQASKTRDCRSDAWLGRTVGRKLPGWRRKSQNRNNS